MISAEIVEAAVNDMATVMEMEYGADFNRDVLERMARTALATMDKSAIHPFYLSGYEAGTADERKRCAQIAGASDKEIARAILEER